MEMAVTYLVQRKKYCKNRIINTYKATLQNLNISIHLHAHS